MTHPLFEQHRATLEGALQAIATRGYWSPYTEMPSPKAYGETAAEDGKRAYEAHLGQNFELNQPGHGLAFVVSVEKVLGMPHIAG